MLVIAALACSACGGSADPSSGSAVAPAATSSAKAPRGPTTSPLYILPPPGREEVEQQVLATNGPTFGAVTGATLKALLPSSLAGAPLTAHIDGRYSAAATYRLPDGQLATLELLNTFHRGTHSDSLEELNDKSPRLCAKHETLQGEDACIATRLATGSAEAGTVIRWYLSERIVVHLTAPTEALARELATGVPIDHIATLSAAP